MRKKNIQGSIESDEKLSELIDVLNPGECADIELTDAENEPIIKAHICKSKKEP